MNNTEIILSVGGSAISLLIGLVGYLSNRQLQRVDDKISKVDSEFFEVKSRMIENIGINNSAIIKHLDNNVMPYLKSNKLDEQVAGIRSDVTILKEYQRNKISPTLDRVLIMGDKIEDQSKKQKESDEILVKMFEVVKKLVEKKDRAQ